MSEAYAGRRGISSLLTFGADLLDILAIEPFFGGSHSSWLRGLQEFSSHNFRMLTLPARYWKWRMQGGAVILAQQYNALEKKPDLILCSDMLDVATFKGLLQAEQRTPPIVLYFHENQLSYPWSPKDRDRKKGRDRFFGFRNFVSALSADSIVFNSRYNKESFFREVNSLLFSFPDYQQLANLEEMEGLCQVLPPAIDFSSLPVPKEIASKRMPGILWNHRWEYDKNPGDFFRALQVLSDRNREFSLVVVGEQTDVVPVEFLEAQERLQDHIDHWGYMENRDRYAECISKCDYLPVTSHQEFFGISVVEAMYVGCRPLLPNRLAYPDLIPENFRAECLYGCFDELVERLDTLIQNESSIDRMVMHGWAQQYSWENWIERYDQYFEEVCPAE